MVSVYIVLNVYTFLSVYAIVLDYGAIWKSVCGSFSIFHRQFLVFLPGATGEGVNGVSGSSGGGYGGGDGGIGIGVPAPPPGGVGLPIPLGAATAAGGGLAMGLNTTGDATQGSTSSPAPPHDQQSSHPCIPSSSSSPCASGDMSNGHLGVITRDAIKVRTFKQEVNDASCWLTTCCLVDKLVQCLGCRCRYCNKEPWAVKSIN